jgi:hypothetical protein
MGSAYGDFKKCPFDKKPCPPFTCSIFDENATPDTVGVGCYYYYDTSTCTFDWFGCRRHPEKAAAFEQEQKEVKADLIAASADLIAASKARRKEYEDMFAAVFSIRGTIPEDEFEKKLAAVRLEVMNKIDAFYSKKDSNQIPYVVHGRME